MTAAPRVDRWRRRAGRLIAHGGAVIAIIMTGAGEPAFRAEGADGGSLELGGAAQVPPVRLVVTERGSRRERVLRPVSFRPLVRRGGPGGEARDALSEERGLRALVRFDVRSVGDVADAKVVIVGQVTGSGEANDHGLVVHPVRGHWDPDLTTWRIAPPVGRARNASLRTDGASFEATIPVGDLVARWASVPWLNEGLLLRYGHLLGDAGDGLPVESPAVTIEGSPVGASASRILDWAPSVREALTRARVRGRRVVLFLDIGRTRGSPSSGGELVVWLLLARESVRNSIARSFVPVGVACPPEVFTNGQELREDPLEPYGVGLGSFRPPALIVVDPSAGVVAAMESIGTFDETAVCSFLAGATVRGIRTTGLDGSPRDPDGRPATSDVDSRRTVELAREALERGEVTQARGLLSRHDGSTADAQGPAAELLGVCLLRQGDLCGARNHFERAVAVDPLKAEAARYYLGCLDWRRGHEDAALAGWGQLAIGPEDSAWTIAARTRIAETERISMFECLESPTAMGRGKCSGSLESEATVSSWAVPAIAYLLVQQRPDGSWSPAGLGRGPYRLGITAIVARALLAWRDDLAEPTRHGVDLAVARAAAWLVANVDDRGAQETNSFGAAYALQFWVEFTARNAGARANAEAAIRVLEGGQCRNGAWSYSARFAETWRGGVGGWPRTNSGRAHSVNTAVALSALLDAREIGLTVTPSSIVRGADALLQMKHGPGAFTYTWPDPVLFAEPGESLARGAVCESALRRLGLSSAADLDASVRQFLVGRSWLGRSRKATPEWTRPGGIASYFFLFAYLHASDAITLAGGAQRDDRLASLRSEMLQVVEPDGTWLDEPALGKCYGTGMALLILRRVGLGP